MEIGNYSKRLQEAEFVLTSNVQESETFKTKIQKLVGENTSLGD